MKKIALLFAACFLIVATADARRGNRANRNVAPVSVMKNAVDSMSYALGVSIGSEILESLGSIPGGEYNTAVFLDGLKAALENNPNNPPLMPLEFAQDYFQIFIMEAYEKETQAMRLEGENFLKENRSKTGVNETASGLQYIIERNAVGAKPSATDVVRVHYEGRLLDGTVFDSSYMRGEPIEFPLNQVIPGWTEGVQLMPVGSKFRFFIPYNLAYGERGAGQVIPPFSTLIFDVELLDIIR